MATRGAERPEMAAPKREGGPREGGARGEPSLRLSSERYLRAQPAVGVLLRGFLRAVMLQRPHDVLEFAAEYFTDPELPVRVRQELEADRGHRGGHGQ